MIPRVAVTIVTYHSGLFIRACLESVFAQQHVETQVIVVDNASSDDTLDILKEYESRIRLIVNRSNLGFAAAQNQAIASCDTEWVLVLNPDTVLEIGFVSQLLEAGESDRDVGTVCGRMLALRRDLRPLPSPRIDTAGIYFTPSLRHLDRGFREDDDGRYRQREYVFGASAAAALYRRAMIHDISLAGEFFDPDFFSYREDADVAWRAQWRGWHCLYVPDAIGYHVRSVGPDQRRHVAPHINMHSVKNRFLMRAKNMTGGLYRRFWLPITVRDVLVFGACLLWEQRSLPAFWRAAKCLPRALRQRRWILSRRRVSDETMAQWFNTQPSAKPLERAPAAVRNSLFLTERSR
ncbi:MAG: glycosyltransferase family 2 protein [Acidobacteriaceae bacterium]|nr:glycosyltransferase family 2 protein [Acidobacteriaceae bacterium]